MLFTSFKKFENNRVFTEAEGWMLFRLAAVGEACGWTMLIFGIVCQRYIMPGNAIPVQFAGHVHGVLFLVYALAAVGLYPTLRWSRWRALVALLASVPPYGSLIFERWAWHKRRSSEFKTYSCCIALALLDEKF